MLISLFIYLMMISPCFSADLSLLDVPKKIEHKKEEQKSIKGNSDPDDQRFQKMQEFIAEENKRLNAIKILSLDLEQADLELKKREIEVRLSQLNTSLGQQQMQVSDEKRDLSIVKLSGIFLNKDFSQAYINVDGRSIIIREKDVLNNGLTIEKIKSNEIILKDKDGVKRSIQMDS